MDIQKYVGVVDFFNRPNKGKNSLELREDIERARLIQIKRYKYIPGITCNAQLPASLIDEFCPLDDESLNLLRKASELFHYSGRTIHKYIKIARTIADLEDEPSINNRHMKKESSKSRFGKRYSSTITQGVKKWIYTGFGLARLNM